MDKRKRLSVIAGGAGGQGILTLGKVLACAGINREWQVTCLPTYGAEMRGGYVYCILTFSTGRDIHSPVISRADAGVFLNDRSVQMLSPSVKAGGYLFLNSSLMEKPPDRKFKTFEIPASETAESLGSLQVANMVMTGALLYVVTREFLPLEMEDLRCAVQNVIAGKEACLVSEKALQAGWDFIHQQWKT